MVARRLIDPVLAMLGESVFGLSENLDTVSTGSGDGVMAYLSLFLGLLVSLLATLIWSIVDQARSNYVKLQFWFLSTLRVLVAIFMLLYGFAKVFLIQFRTPSLTKMVQTVGEMSPMGLAWTFMGFNPIYTIFTGLLEVVAGLLLIFRPSKTLGAILTVGVMGHVAMMNLCFDIPVKIFSLHLVLMGLILLVADRKRIAGLIGRLNKVAIEPEYHPIAIPIRKTINKIKAFAIGFILLGICFFGFVIQREYRKDQNLRDEHYGIYEIEDFTRTSSTTLDTLNGDTWKYIIMERIAKANIKTKDSLHAYHFIINLEEEAATVYKKDADSIAPNFRISKVSDRIYKLDGTIENDSISFKMKQMDLDKFPLISTGFRWVNETPFNR